MPVILEVRTFRPATLTGPASYTTSGEDVTAGDFKLSRIDALIAGASTSGYVVAFNPTTSKLVWYTPDGDGGMEEVTAATDLGAETLPVLAIGLP